MRVVVGKVIELALNTPFITPNIIKPFIFVIDALITTLFRPEIGSEILIIGVVNTCKSYLK
jgi:hypothetical protein